MILSRAEAVLSESQLRLFDSAWGKAVRENTILSRIEYDSDGRKVQGYVCHPKDTGKKYPVIIWNRGGYKNDGRIDPFLASGMFGEIASWGYVVLASSYRDEDEFGGREINDVMNLMDIAGDMEYSDSSRIGMEGWSRGGMMTYKALTLTDRVKCAVIVSGISNMQRRISEDVRRLEFYGKIFGTEVAEDTSALLNERSAMMFADRICRETNILLIHGTADERVSYLDSVEMHELLNSEGVNCELKLIDRGDHYLKKHRKQVRDLRRNWFEKYLKEN